ncbi:MAG TPA: hypothetical protein VGN63_19595 [Flavisolibacter sp.]|jgi:hypothetical protein|nr:hypothetical protein [Flavisolibacter sp.]
MNNEEIAKQTCLFCPYNVECKYKGCSPSVKEFCCDKYKMFSKIFKPAPAVTPKVNLAAGMDLSGVTFPYVSQTVKQIINNQIWN